MSNERYTMSFTTGGLFHRESVELAALYLALGGWDSVMDRVMAENLLQTRTVNSLKRISSEVISRLMTFSKGELEFLVESNHNEQAYLLWVAVCRRYKFIAEFAVEVLREHYHTLKPDVSRDDFDYFYNRKSDWHLELDEITPSTREKLRQVLFKILREADLITTNNMILAAMLSPRLIDLIQKSGRRDILYFPIFESDVLRMTQ